MVTNYGVAFIVPFYDDSSIAADRAQYLICRLPIQVMPRINTRYRFRCFVLWLVEVAADLLQGLVKELERLNSNE